MRWPLGEASVSARPATTRQGHQARTLTEGIDRKYYVVPKEKLSLPPEPALEYPSQELQGL
jgi:hypothetical protein